MVFGVSVHSYSCAMTWCWPEFEVEISCHVIKLLATCLFVVIENIDIINTKLFIVPNINMKAQKHQLPQVRDPPTPPPPILFKSSMYLAEINILISESR